MSRAGALAPGLLARLSRPPQRVALLKPSRIGDFICATPAMRALRQALPDAEITLVTLPMLRDMAERSALFDRVVDFPGYPGLAEQLFAPRRAAGFFVAMQAQRFDLALQLQGSGVNANPFALMIGARHTAGFVRPGDGPGLLDAALPLPDAGHEIDRMLALPAFLGAPAAGRATEFPLWLEDHELAAELLLDAEPPLIGLHPGARDASRRWPVARFAAVARELRARHGGTLALLGEPGDRVTAALAAALGDTPFVRLDGRTRLPTLGALIARLALLVTNDTGPAHIAYALGTPTLTIFGAGDPDRYGPPAAGPFVALAHPVGCRPCGLAECPIGEACLRGVTVEQVIEAAETVCVPAACRPAAPADTLQVLHQEEAT